MAPGAMAYSNGFGPSTGYMPRKRHGHGGSGSLADRARLLPAAAARALHKLWLQARTNGLPLSINLARRAAWQLRQNLTARRVLSFPHLLVGLWMVVLLWGEYWVFSDRVGDCRWESWEKWPAGSTPHHLIFIADPQLIDPHSYPGRNWALSVLTLAITDNYISKSYRQLQSQLYPDSVFFLGDLFDGGREWKTATGDFRDPKWAAKNRPKNERRYLDEWRRKYGEDFWLREYQRFGDIFFKDWLIPGPEAGPWQRGRKIVASLPGNHDLGFGDEIKLPVRGRFNAFFGEGNRVDVVGNHTIVSVDTVSLSARSSDMIGRVDLKPIYGPAEEFLDNVKATKRRAVERELRFWQGDVENLPFEHKVEDVRDADVTTDKPSSSSSSGKQVRDFPTILLTHVPLYREPGTPCGPFREHWPPLPKPAGQTEPVRPDHRNAISVSRGYQYQNVLSEADSVKLVKSVGNVVHVFSGDDHDYCELVHSREKDGVREITVKSTSMAMGVPTPGIVMVSMYNPVDALGNPVPGAPEQTLQTHLCHLPNMISTYIKYAAFAIVCIVAMAIRAILTPVLNLTPFALAATPPGGPAASLLPSYKDKKDDDGGHHHQRHSSSATSGTSSQQHHSSSRGVIGSSSRNRNASPTGRSRNHHHSKWSFGEGGKGGPRIDIHRDDDLYDTSKSRSTFWRAATAGRSRTTLGVVGREFATSTWRVVWMTLLFFAYLVRSG